MKTYAYNGDAIIISIDNYTGNIGLTDTEILCETERLNLIEFGIDNSQLIK